MFGQGLQWYVCQEKQLTAPGPLENLEGRWVPLYLKGDRFWKWMVPQCWLEIGRYSRPPKWGRVISLQQSILNLQPVWALCSSGPGGASATGGAGGPVWASGPHCEWTSAGQHMPPSSSLESTQTQTRKQTDCSFLSIRSRPSYAWNDIYI